MSGQASRGALVPGPAGVEAAPGEAAVVWATTAGAQRAGRGGKAAGPRLQSGGREPLQKGLGLYSGTAGGHV